MRKRLMGGRHVLAFSRKADAALAKKTALQSLSLDAARDATSARCIPKNAGCSARIIAESDFILCGVLEADAIFKSRRLKAEWKFSEGEKVKRGDSVCRLSGSCRGILACERSALNYLMLLSGIASKCASASAAYGKGRICATRKTLPMLTQSEKRAVALGGCLTHRLSLSDGILVKDNHLASIMRQARVKKERAIEMAVGCFGLGEFVEVEVSSVSEALAAASAGAGAILADNVSPKKLRKIAAAARRANPRIIIEASGGITLENAGTYLKAGADFASTSELTMKISPANLSLEIDAF